jgi:hypothetical protein
MNTILLILTSMGFASAAHAEVYDCRLTIAEQVAVKKVRYRTSPSNPVDPSKGIPDEAVIEVTSYNPEAGPGSFSSGGANAEEGFAWYNGTYEYPVGELTLDTTNCTGFGPGTNCFGNWAEAGGREHPMVYSTSFTSRDQTLEGIRKHTMITMSGTLTPARDSLQVQMQLIQGSGTGDSMAYEVEPKAKKLAATLVSRGSTTRVSGGDTDLRAQLKCVAREATP